MRGVIGDRSRRRIVLMMALLITAATPARAQFSFFGPSEASPQDIYDTIAEHGFRLVGPLYRNGRVYLADVIDRRQRRERLVIAADNGQIVQRFLVDLGGLPGRREPAIQPVPPHDDSFFSHLTRGWDDDTPPRPPLGLDGTDNAVPSPTPLAPPPRHREPRVVTRTEGVPVAPPAAVTSAPLPSAAPLISKPDDGGKQPDSASAPAAAPPASGRGTTVSTDPLRIPGSRHTDPTKPAPSLASKTPTPPPPPPAQPPAKTPPAPAGDVPVAPLD